MIVTLNSKGQVTLPKQIRDALDMQPGCPVNFSVNQVGDIVIHKVCSSAEQKPDRYDAARGKADIKWRSEELRRILRSA